MYKNSWNLKRSKQSIIPVLLAISAIMIIIGGCVYAATKNNSKNVYVSILNNLAQESRSYMEKLPTIETKYGKFIINSNIYNNDDNNYELYYQGDKFLVKTKDFKVLYNENCDEVYARKIENEKEVGDTLLYRRDNLNNSNSWYYDDSYKIRLVLDKFNSDFENKDVIAQILDSLNLKEYIMEQRNQLELTAIISETIAKNLKDSYFVDSKANVYTLSLNNKQLTELIENVVIDLNNNQRFLKITDSDPMTDEELEKNLSQIKEEFEKLNDFKFTLSISMMKDVYKGSAIIKFDNEFDVDITFELSEKLFKLTGSTRPSIYDDKIEFEFKISTEDGKKFIESSSIIANLDMVEYGKKHNLKITIKGNSPKSMLDSSNISLNVIEDDEEHNDIFKVYSEDKKSFKESAKVILEINSAYDTIKMVVSANDNKKIIASSYVSLLVGNNDKLLEVISLKANDNKAIINTTDLTINVPDNNSDSVFDQIDYEPVIINIKSNNKKAILKSSDIEIYCKGEISYNDVDVKITLKSNTQLIDAKKIDFTLDGTIDDAKISLSGKIENKENKILRNSKNLNGSFKAHLSNDEYEATIEYDSEKGYDYEVYRKSNPTERERIKLEYQPVDFDKLMNTKNAKKSSYYDIISVLNGNVATFASEFGEYMDRMLLDSANIKATCGIRGIIINYAQMYFLASKGEYGEEFVQDAEKYSIPVGYVLTNSNPKDSLYKDVLKSILIKDDEENVVAYEIDDSKTTFGQKRPVSKFYSDTNGEEKHLITSNGKVFTLPGYPMKQSDGTIEYHIGSINGQYYVVTGNSSLKVGDTNVNGDVITNTEPIQFSDLKETMGILAITGEKVSQ